MTQKLEFVEQSEISKPCNKCKKEITDTKAIKLIEDGTFHSFYCIKCLVDQKKYIINAYKSENESNVIKIKKIREEINQNDMNIKFIENLPYKKSKYNVIN